MERLGLDVSVDTAVDVVLREKAIKPASRQLFIEDFTPCLRQVSGVKELWLQVEEMRAVSYQQTHHDHEEALLLVCIDSFHFSVHN